MTPSVFESGNREVINLPEVSSGQTGSLPDLLYKRRSVRRSAQGSLELGQLSQLVFAAQGITRRGGFRAAPSAGALYPLEIYILSGKVQDLAPGIYKYRPQSHDLIRTAQQDLRSALADAALGQAWISQAQIVLVICAVYDRVTSKYGSRGLQYVHIEAGCASQNISLQAADLNLGTTVVGAFHDGQAARVIGAEKKEDPLIIMPVGLLD